MLKYEGQWKALSERERLVLVALAFELPQVSGMEVRDYDIAIVSSLDGPTLHGVAVGLESKGLIKYDRPGGDTFCGFLSLAGDAFTTALGQNKVGEEFARQEREMGRQAKHRARLLRQG
jgi:hypothetical protein